MAHPDLVKVWGSARPLPERDPRHYYEPAVEAMLEAGVAMEVSTAGLRKPVGELYPAPALLEMAVDAGLPIALSSDAHVPDQLGFRYDDARRRAARGRRERDLRVRGPRSGGWSRSADVRTGLGVDTHAFAPGRRLILGGVEIPHEHGLAGHSDADVLTHAVIDALLGAAGLGDIGQHFPDTDAACDGRRLARSCCASSPGARGAGCAIGNVDATVVLERPKLAPHRDAIRRRWRGALGVEPERVNVKATTGEGMGFVGRGEGVAALAVATVRGASRNAGDTARTAALDVRDATSGRIVPRPAR